MSRSNPTTTNPARKFYSWAGSDGNLVYWDKDQEKEIKVTVPFEFMVLDQLSTITGWSDEDESRYWSNEVRDITNDELTVKTSKRTHAVAKYGDLTEVRAKGAKYAKSVYIAFKDGNELVIGNFKVYGAALTAWIDFTKKTDVYKCAVVLKGKSDVQTKGKTEYYLPVFEKKQVTPDTNEEAVRLDKELQDYLRAYFSLRNVDEETAKHSLSDEVPVEVYDGAEPADETTISDIPS